MHAKVKLWCRAGCSQSCVLLSMMQKSGWARVIAGTLLFGMLAACKMTGPAARPVSNPKHGQQRSLLQEPQSSATGVGSGDSERSISSADVVLAIPSELSRLSLVAASRAWRNGLRTFIALEQPITQELIRSHPIIEEGMANHNETYGYSKNWRAAMHRKAGDRRATLTPFIAAEELGAGSCKWMVFGDDDTVWFLSNVLNMLSTMDSAVPYLLTDHIWWPWWTEGREVQLHANRLAPRCLPCSYQDPLLANHTPSLSQFSAQPSCHCNQAAICEGVQHGLPGASCPAGYGMGSWYFPHGGAGMIFSSGLLQRVPLQQATQWIDAQPDIGSGDSMVASLVYSQVQIMPTDPGYGYLRPNIRLFDPGWKGPQMKGPEDESVPAMDNGNDPAGLIRRFQAAIGRDGCHEECQDQLEHVLSCHLRARHASSERKADRLELETALQDAPTEAHQIAVRLHHRLGHLVDIYDGLHPGRSWFSQLSLTPRGSFT